MKLEYIVIVKTVVNRELKEDARTNLNYQYSFNWDGERFDSHEDALNHGFSIGVGNDFNIGGLEGGELVSFYYMHQRINVNLQVISEKIGLANS